MNFSEIWPLTKSAFNEWSEDKVPRLSAALAYYTMLSIAPLMIIMLKIIGVIFGEEAAQHHLQGYVAENVGAKASEAINDMMSKAGQPGSGVMATVISAVILLFSASGVFGELQDSLNTIWEVKPKPGRGIWRIIQARFFSMTLVLGTAFLLIVSLIISATVTALTKNIGGEGWLWEAVHQLISVGILAGLFALMFKYLPDVKVAWRHVWIGAVTTAVLFTIGKFLLGWYLGRASTTSVYGAAGSLVALLIWVYYSAQIFFFGAELTQAHVQLHGEKLEPAKDAVQVTEEERAQKGMPHKETVHRKAADDEARRAPRLPAKRRSPILPILAGLALGRYLIPKKKPKVVRQQVYIAPRTRFERLRAAGDRDRLAEVERALVKASPHDRAPDRKRAKLSHVLD